MTANSHTNSEPKKVTLSDVAKEAKVSPITVSRAFSSPDLVKPQTRDLVFKVAAKLNYSPNAFARNLKTNSSPIIGVVTDSTYNPVYAQVVKTLYEEADKSGYIIIMFETAGNAERERKAMETLFSYKVAGIVLSVVNDSENYHPDYIQKARYNNIPLVLLDRDIKNENLPGVFLNNFEIGTKAGLYLSEETDKKILVIGGPQDSQITIERIAGIKESLAHNKISCDTIYANYSYDKAREIILNYLENKTRLPDIIVGINGPISLAAIGVCRNLHLRDILFFSIDAVPYAKDFGYNVPCIYSDPTEWGLRVSELLFKLIEHDNSPRFFDRIFIYGKLVA